MSTNEAGIFRFGDFELDAGRRLLRSTESGDVVPLTPKAFDILQFIVERAGKVVHKNELIDAAWPDVVVEENSLTQAISTLRRALGEKPREHRYIATVPGRGYRFVAAVRWTDRIAERSDDEPLPSTAVERSSAAISQQTRRLESSTRMSEIRRATPIYGAILFAVVVGLVIFSVMPDDSTNTREDPIELMNRSLISEGAHHQQPTLSSDATMVAFVSNASGKHQIWVKSVEGGGAIQLTDLQGGAEHPTWSTSGNNLIYFHDADNGGIWSVAALGTREPRRLIAEGKNPSVSYSGDTIVYELEGRIRLANADGSNQRSVPGVPEPDREWRFYSMWPALSPDGERVAFFRRERGPRGDIWTISVDGNDLKPLTDAVSEAGPLSWSRDGRYIWFSGDRGGVRTLWRVAVDDGEPEAVTGGIGEDRDFALSADNSRIVFTNARPQSRFTVWDPESGERTSLYETRSKISFPAVSNDGLRIAYFAKTGDLLDERIWLLNADGNTPPTPLTTAGLGEQHIMPRWSHDDKTVYYYRVDATWSLYGILSDGGPPFEQFPEFSWPGNKDVAFSPSGDRIVYVEKVQLEPAEVRTVIRDLAGDRTTELPSDIVFAPSWSDDSLFILGASPDGVAVCRADGSDCETIVRYDPGLARSTDSPELGNYAQFSWDQTRVFFTRRTDDPLTLELWVIDRDGTDSQPLFRYGPVDPLAGRFQVLPGDRILWDEYEPDPAELWMATITGTDN